MPDKRTRQAKPESSSQRPLGTGKRATGTSIGTVGGSYVNEEHRLGFDDAGLHIPTGNSEVLLTRRQLLYGALGLAGVAAVGGVATAVGNSAGAQNEVASLEVAENDAFTLDDCEEVAVEDAFTLLGEYKLPYGSLVWAGNSGLAACLLPTETAKPLVQAALINLESGYEATVLQQADGQDEGFEIYDIRAGEDGVVWTEANILTGEWRVYVATVSLMELERHHLVDSGDARLEMPTLAVTGNTVFWQVLPALPAETNDEGAETSTPAAPDGGADAAQQDEAPTETLVKCVSFKKPSDVRTIFTFEGRCATALAPANAETGVVVTPLHPDAASHRQMLLIDAKGATMDSLTFPSRMTPMEACYGATGFAFSFDSIYNYGEGIANLGTYTPQEKPADGAYSRRPWFHFERTPSMPPAWCGNWFMVKSSSAVVGVDTAEKRYALLPTDNNAEAYGDCLASIGAGETVVTFTNIDRTEAVADNEEVTDDDKLCLVRVWAPGTGGAGTGDEDEG